jgi:hypothetical protein
MRTFSPLLLLFLLVGLLALTNTARADCTSPTGIAGDIIYSANYNVPAYCNGSSWVTLAGGTTGGGGGGSAPAGSLNDVQFNNGAGLGADTGNFTYSADLLTTPNLSTGNVSATTLSTTGLGTLGSLLVAGGATVAGQASLTVISTSLIQVGNNGASCTSGLAGAIRYSSISSTIEYCQGTGWTSLGPSDTTPIAFSAYMTTGLTTISGSTVKMPFNAEAFSSGGAFSTSNNRFIAPIAGRYWFNASAYCTDATADCALFFYKNGSIASEGVKRDRAAVPTLVWMTNLGAGDYVEVYVRNSGIAVNSGSSLTYFQGAFVGPQSGGSGGGTANPAGSTNDVQFNSGGLLAADTGNFTYSSGILSAPAISTTSISATVANIASISTVSNVIGGSGNIISSGSAVVSASSDGNISFFTTGEERLHIDNSGTVVSYVPVWISSTATGAKFSTTNGTGQRTSIRTTATGEGMIWGYDDVNGHTEGVNVGGDGVTIAKGLYVDGSGYAYLGGTTTYAGNNAKLMIHYEGGGTRHGITLHPAADTTNAIDFLNAAGTRIGSVSQNTTATAFNTSSDRRVKKNITDTREGLQKLMQLPVRDFVFRADPSHTIVTGFIAQEVEKVFPEAVTTNGDNGEVPLKDKNNIWQVDYGRVTPLIVKAVQDLKHLFDADHAAVAKLQAANDDFTNKLDAANDNIKELKALVDRQGHELQALRKSLVK